MEDVIGVIMVAISAFVIGAFISSIIYEVGKKECESSLPRDVYCEMYWRETDGTE